MTCPGEEDEEDDEEEEVKEEEEEEEEEEGRGVGAGETSGEGRPCTRKKSERDSCGSECDAASTVCGSRGRRDQP